MLTVIGVVLSCGTRFILAVRRRFWRIRSVEGVQPWQSYVKMECLPVIEAVSACALKTLHTFGDAFEAAAAGMMIAYFA